MNTLSIILLCLVIISIGIIIYFNSQLKKKEKEIENNKELIKSYQDIIKIKDTEIKNLNKKIEEKDIKIKDLEKALEEKEQLIITIMNNNPESIKIKK